MITIRYEDNLTDIVLTYTDDSKKILMETTASDILLTPDQLTKLALLMLEVASKAALTHEEADDEDYSTASRIDPYDGDGRARRDEDIPF